VQLWSQVVAVSLGLLRNVVAVWSQSGDRALVRNPVTGPLSCGDGGAPRGIRTPNRQIRRLVLYVHAVRLSAVYAAQVKGRIQPVIPSAVW
jgi:hypothetical protein